jgi:hypothetical protein
MRWKFVFNCVWWFLETKKLFFVLCYFEESAVRLSNGKTDTMLSCTKLGLIFRLGVPKIFSFVSMKFVDRPCNWCQMQNWIPVWFQCKSFRKLNGEMILLSDLSDIPLSSGLYLYASQLFTCAYVFQVQLLFLSIKSFVCSIIVACNNFV